MTRGIQLPTLNANKQVFEGEEQSDWMMSVESSDEYALAAEISETVALEPQNLTEAKSWPDWPLWEKAIEDELGQLKAASTWKLINSPEGVNIVGSKWVFRAKKDASSKVVCYKAHPYLNGVLTSEEKIFMKQPPGYSIPNSSGKVCLLLKTLYGIKQSRY